MEHVLTLGMLIFLQAVLGFDNLLYISLESKRVAEDRQSFVRRTGIGLAIALRIILLFVLVKAISMFQEPFFSPNWGFFEGKISIHSLIVLIGGVFIIYTAVKEIVHMLSLRDLDQSLEEEEKSSVGKAITWIVTMNLIFSVDSILSAIALTDNFTIMAIAILVSGGLMIALADRVSVFLEKNRLYEVLGLFILFIVGIMLLTEGGHLAHLKFFGYSIEAMSKSTFYFVIIILVLVDMAQSRYQKKLTSQTNSTT